MVFWLRVFAPAFPALHQMLHFALKNFLLATYLTDME
jgi:hypothetical protein